MEDYVEKEKEESRSQAAKIISQAIEAEPTVKITEKFPLNMNKMTLKKFNEGKFDFAITEAKTTEENQDLESLIQAKPRRDCDCEKVANTTQNCSNKDIEFSDSLQNYQSRNQHVYTSQEGSRGARAGLSGTRQIKKVQSQIVRNFSPHVRKSGFYSPNSSQMDAEAS